MLKSECEKFPVITTILVDIAIIIVSERKFSEQFEFYNFRKRKNSKIKDYFSTIAKYLYISLCLYFYNRNVYINLSIYKFICILFLPAEN